MHDAAGVLFEHDREYVEGVRLGFEGNPISFEGNAISLEENALPFEGIAGPVEELAGPFERFVNPVEQDDGYLHPDGNRLEAEGVSLEPTDEMLVHVAGWLDWLARVGRVYRLRHGSTGGVMSNSERPPSADLRCHVCRYDLRAHADEEVCPECGTAVSQSREVALVPIRPAWRDSDPRWRRRMLLGVWLIVLMPAVRVLYEFGITELVPIGPIFGAGDSLKDTYFANGRVFSVVAFAAGMALLFSPERGRRRTRLDGTHRRGILGCYLVMLFDFLSSLTVIALVAGGVAASFMTIPIEFQPEMTGLLATLSSSYLRFGPRHELPEVLLVLCSAVVVILACTPVVAALRSAGARFWAYVIVAPIAMMAAVQLVSVVMVNLLGVISHSSLGYDSLFFNSAQLANGLKAFSRHSFSVGQFHQSGSGEYFYLEAIKWGVFLLIAVWLTIAQIRARSATTRGV